MESLFDQILSSVVFGLLGIVIMVIGYKVIDFILPADLNKELEKGNVAAGIVIAGIFVTVGIIVSTAIK